MKQIYAEIHSAEELKMLQGCKITSITGGDGGEDFCLDCADEAGNLVSFLILEDGTWHLYLGKPIQGTRNGSLTKDKILKLKPGREMDLHVAVDVTGMNVDEIDESLVPNYN